MLFRKGGVRSVDKRPVSSGQRVQNVNPLDRMLPKTEGHWQLIVIHTRHPATRAASGAKRVLPCVQIRYYPNLAITKLPKSRSFREPGCTASTHRLCRRPEQQTLLAPGGDIHEAPDHPDRSAAGREKASGHAVEHARARLGCRARLSREPALARD